MRKELPDLDGRLYLSTHRASVVSILGDEAPPVYSRGHRFYNRGKWSVRLLADRLCSWGTEHPGEPLTREALRRMVVEVNEVRAENPHIVIASTPPRLAPKLASALIGGAYHEAWHSLYDRQGTLFLVEIAEVVLPRWGLVEDWSRYLPQMLHWINTAMDIRNERLGTREFPPTLPDMEALQDFVIEQESQIRGGQELTPLAVVSCTYRELGLGYATKATRGALDLYREAQPEAFELVTKGPLRPILDRNIAAGREDDILPLTIGMDLVIEVDKLDLIDPKKESSPDGEGEGDEVPVPEKDGGPEGGPSEPFDDPALEGLGEKLRGKETSETKEEPTPNIGDAIRDELAGGGDYAPLDVSEALGSGVREITQDRARDLKEGERLWHPFDLSLDSVGFVRPSKAGVLEDDALAMRILRAVRQECGYFRTRLHTIVRALEMGGEEHGVPEGVDLSDHHLIDTVEELRAGQYPSRPFYRSGEKKKVSLAAHVVLDQSISMITRLGAATALLLAVVEPLDGLGCAVQASGFIDGAKAESDAEFKATGGLKVYHRLHGVRHDVFKLFDEPFRQVRWRFARTRSWGSTPMADGVQFAIESLNRRREGHRLILVVTDGRPNEGHEEVIRFQLRLCRTAGIHVVGVGVGLGAQYVCDLFPDHAWTPDFPSLPRLLVRKLNELFDPLALNRGKTVPQLGIVESG